MAKSASYFRSILTDETEKLNQLCIEWENVLNGDPESAVNQSEEASGQVRSAVGLAHLLVNQRFKQFSGLIKNCEDGTVPKVTTQDLEGFWEMIYYQVEDVHKKFRELKTMRDQLNSSTTEAPSS